MTDREAMLKALDALEILNGAETVEGIFIYTTDEIFALRQALAQPEQAAVAWMRMPKEGDRVVCIEDESLGTVKYLTAGGSPEIKFDDGSHGTYLLREFAELFRYADTALAQPKQEHIECGYDETVGMCTNNPCCEQAQPEQEPDCSEAGHDEGRCGNFHCITKPATPPKPEQFNVSFPYFMRKRIEQALKDAIHPTGMSVHDGKVKVLVSDLHRMLLVIDSVLAQPEHPLDKKADNARELGLDYEPEQEPVATVKFIHNKKAPDVDWHCDVSIWDGAKLYTAPPSKQWVGLTDDELNNISEYGNTDWTKRKSLARAIEAKLKEKNT